MLIELNDDQVDDIILQEMEKLVLANWVEKGIKKHARKVFNYHASPEDKKRLKRLIKLGGSYEF